MILRDSGLKPLNLRRVESLLTLRFPDGGDPLIKIEGNFRVFKHVNNGRVNYSLTISVNYENEEFFSGLEQRIASLACENISKNAKLTSFNPKQAGFFRIWYSWGEGRIPPPCVTSLFKGQ